MKAIPASVAAQMAAAEALARLAIARGGLLDEFTADVYLQRLQRFDQAVVARACAELSDEPRREYETTLPEVGRIIERVDTLTRRDADDAATARLIPSRALNDEDGPTFHCLACFDEPAALRYFWCPGDPRTLEKSSRANGMSTVDCGRHRKGNVLHLPHLYVTRCECSDTNPVIRAHRERLESFRQKKAAK